MNLLSKIVCLTAVAFLCMPASSQVEFWKDRVDWNHATFDVDKRSLDGEFGNDYHEVKFKKEKADKGWKWKVFTDSEGVPVKKEASPDAATLDTKLPMGTALYVADEKGAYLNVYSANSAEASENVEIGWIHKQNLLLWEYPLQERKNKIDIKAFIVNTDEYAKLVKGSIKDTKDVYKIYSSPTSKEPIEEGHLYNVLFVFKYDAANGRFLVSDHYRLTSNEQLVGWVNEDRTKLWETALALEPNFEEKAVQERESKEELLAQVFNEYSEVTRYMGGDLVECLIARDVANASISDLIHKDRISDTVMHIRYEGMLPRFPLYNITESAYECGVVGKLNVGNTDLMKGVTDQRLARAEKKFKQRETSLTYTNIVFVVETSGKRMKPYVDEIVKIMEEVNKNTKLEERPDIKWGFVGYSDANCDEPDEDAVNTIIPCMEDDEFVDQMMSKASFVATGPRDDYEASFYGLKTALDKCKLNENQTNVIVHLGNRPDLQDDFDREDLCIESKPDMVPRQRDIWAALSKYSVNYLAVQCYRDGMDTDSLFIRDARNMMLNASRKMYDEVREKDFYAEFSPPSSPKIVSYKDKPEIGMEDNAVTIMRAIWPDGKNLSNGVIALDTKTFSKEISRSILDARDKAKAEIEVIKRLYMDNSELSSMTSAFGNTAHILSQSGLTAEEIAILSTERVQLYWHGYAPKKLPSAEYDMWKTVLFLSEDKVYDINKQFEGITSAFDAADTETKKMAIKNLWEDIATSVLNMDLDKVRDNVTVDEIRNKMIGLKEQGVSLGKESDVLMNVTLNGIDDLTPKQVNQYLNELQKKVQFWEGVQNGYRFSYYPAGEGENRKKFYWIPFEFLY